MENFTPLTAALGGFCIGMAALLLLGLNGNIAGISGILNRAMEPGPDRVWRWLFVVGLMVGAGTYLAFFGRGFELRQGFPWPLLVLAGFLVGYGTRLGSGCTSGHGVCGIGRLSTRSIVATVVFMVAGIATTYVARHVMGLST
jgi:hypothetical protein